LSEPTHRRQDVDPQEPVNDMRAEIYRRLMEDEQTIAEALYRRDVSHDAVLAALDAVDERMSVEERREDLHLSALAHYVGALGGRIEVRAVFGQEDISVRRVEASPGS
jgi:pyruvate/2-oxoglutarate dehydrogenase complex dihydrolipoamide acyltransferase (E2) component